MNVSVCETPTHCQNSLLTHDTQLHKNETTQVSLGPLAADAAHELHVLRVDGHSLGVDRAEVAVFEQTGEISLGGGLASQNGVRLEAEIGFEILRYLMCKKTHT